MQVPGQRDNPEKRADRAVAVDGGDAVAGEVAMEVATAAVQAAALAAVILVVTIARVATNNANTSRVLNEFLHRGKSNSGLATKFSDF